MPTGKVKYFNDEKGYGFIAPDDGSTDVFAHRQECNAERGSYLEPGDLVTYETAFDERKGKIAATFVSPWKVGGEGGGRGGGGGQKMCRDFQAGRCTREKCIFSHDMGGERDRSRSRDRGSYGQPSHGYGYPQPSGYPQPGYGYMPPGYGGPPPGYGGPSLPPGWEQLADPATGRPYFCNRSTGESSWTPPPSGGPGGGLPPGWEEARDPASGRTYYFNRSTNTTQWNPP